MKTVKFRFKSNSHKSEFLRQGETCVRWMEKFYNTEKDWFEMKPDYVTKSIHSEFVVNGVVLESWIDVLESSDLANYFVAVSESESTPDPKVDEKKVVRESKLRNSENGFDVSALSSIGGNMDFLKGNLVGKEIKLTIRDGELVFYSVEMI